MDVKERIEQAAAAQGLTIQSWKDDPDDGPTAVFGRYKVITDEYEDNGLYLDDEGELTATVVGAAQYHNERVHFGFTADDVEGAEEVRDLTALDPVD